MKEDYVDMIKEIILKRVPLDKYAVFLFGSRAVGNAHQMSDIDVGILGEMPLPLLIKADIEETISESIVPFRVDLIEFNQADTRFKEEALTKIIVWNSPKNLKLDFQI